MLEEIKDGDLIVTPNYIKKKILKDLSKEKKLINCKFMTIEEFKKNVFETYDEKSIYYIMTKYNLKYDIAKEYLENIFLNYEPIKKIYNDLKKNKLIIKNKMLNKKNIKVIGYESIEPFILKKLNDYNFKILNLKKEKYTHKVYEFETQTDEVVYTATKVIECLNKININDINLVIPSEEYLNELERIFELYNIPLNINQGESIYSTKTASDFIKKLKETKNIKKSLVSINQNDIYNQIVDIINKYIFIKDVDDTFIEIIENEIKKVKIKTNKKTNAVNVINIDEVYDKTKYYFILGLNQNVLPKLHSDNMIISDDKRNALGLFTSAERNKNEIEKIKDILTSYPNLFLSYKLRDNYNNYYPSQVINELKLDVVINPKPKLIYSNKYNKLLLANLLDDYVNYNEEDERLYSLFSSYKDFDYKTYKNDFTQIDKSEKNSLTGKNITLSYSSINNYFLCPFKFYIQNILKLYKNEESIQTLIGNLFHYVLQNLYNDNFDLDYYYEDYLKDKKLSAKEKFYLNKLKKILKEDIKIIKYQDSHSLFNKKLTEKKIVIDKRDNIKFIGFVDKVSILDDYVIITDYKTGNIDTTLDNIDDGLNMQLPTYIYLIKKGTKNDKKIVGFYLQKLLNSKKIDKEENSINNLKLNGYTINDEDIISKIDDTYTNSEIIKGMKKTKTSFYSYTKLINQNDLDKIANIVDENIEKVIKSIENNNYKINPKRLNGELISCKYCSFKDLCYYKEEDITNLKLKTFKEIVGDDNA